MKETIWKQTLIRIILKEMQLPCFETKTNYIYFHFLGPKYCIHLQRFLIPYDFGLKNEI